MPQAKIGDVTLHYQSHGDGPPVLAIMGFALDQRFWAAQVGPLSEGHRFITFDNRGVGRSTGPTVATIDEMAEDAVRLLDHLEIDTAVVFGVSMGGTIAQRVALNYPERVRALILAATWARPIEFMRRQANLARHLIEDTDPETFIDASLLWMFTPRFFEVGQDAIDRMIRGFFAESGPEVARRDVLVAQLEAISKHDVLDELSRIYCPTLVVGGKMDMMVPYFAAEEIAGAIPGAQLVSFGSGHGLMLEEMEAFNAAVAKFLADL